MLVVRLRREDKSRDKWYIFTCHAWEMPCVTARPPPPLDQGAGVVHEGRKGATSPSRPTSAADAVVVKVVAEGRSLPLYRPLGATSLQPLSKHQANLRQDITSV